MQLELNLFLILINMFCDNCGKKLIKGSIFCDICGRSVKDNKENSPMDRSGTTISVVQKLTSAKPSGVLAVFILISVMVGGIFAFSVFKKYQSNLNTTSKELTKMQTALENIQSSANASLSSLEEENEKLQKENKKLQVVVSAPQAPTKKEMMSSNSDTLSQELLSQIMLRIVKVRCLTGSGINEGSGVIQTFVGNNIPWSVYTNLHVVGLGNNAGVCSISLPQIPDYVPTTPHRAVTERVAGQYPDIDFAVLKVSGAIEFFNESPIPTCGVADIKIGDQVTVLGYPSFGGNSLTVTDGIISGIEYTSYGPIYKTSAKIDEGNSGGLAIDNNSKCGVGMPTWAVSGKFEGLGYIQSWDMIKKSGNL